MVSDFLYKKLQTPGERIKALRAGLGMSRKEFSEKHGFSQATLRSIESSARPLTPAQLQKFIRSFDREGLTCSAEWIMTGEGDAPSEKKEGTPSSPSRDPLFLEAALFQQHNPASLIIQVEDDNMSPLYQKHDYVGGTKIHRSLKSSAYGKSYLVVFPDETKRVRLLYPGSQKGLFNLVSSNLIESSTPSLHIDVPLKAIYEIIWHRRKPSQ